MGLMRNILLKNEERRTKNEERRTKNEERATARYIESVRVIEGVKGEGSGVCS